MYNFLIHTFYLLGSGTGVAYFLRLRLLVFFLQPAPTPRIQKHPAPTSSGSPALDANLAEGLALPEPKLKSMFYLLPGRQLAAQASPEQPIAKRTKLTKE